jgi:transcriptional regulator with XRE-family HTH domain
MMGAELRRLRRHRLQWTQKQLAERMATTSTTVARWERGEQPISELVARFVRLIVATEATPTNRKR